MVKARVKENLGTINKRPKQVIFVYENGFRGYSWSAFIKRIEQEILK